MTRTELIERVRNARFLRCERLANCTAWIEEVQDTETGEVYYRLRSYSTIVACLWESQDYGRTVIVFDYWSSTTAQHISKFARHFDTPTFLYLYVRSDRVFFITRDFYDGWHCRYFTDKFHSKQEILMAQDNDWYDIINTYTDWGWE